MKKLSILIALILLFSCLASCTKKLDTARADELSKNFIESVLSHNTDELKKYIHPKADKNFVSDEFLKEIADKYLLEEGDMLTGLASREKRFGENSALGGDMIECDYVARIDELIYDITVVILSDDENYGVIGFSVNLSNPEDFYISEKQ